MKILITSYWYAPAINGVVTSVQNLEQELVKKGHEVKILTISHDSTSYKRDNVYYIGSLSLGHLYPHARFPVKSQYKYYDEILAWNPDIVHSQCEFFTFSISVKVAKTLDIPLIHTYHTIYEDYTHYFSPSHTVGKNAVALFSKKVLTKADKVIAPTNKVKDILNGYKVTTDISTVSTGIDIDKFRTQQEFKVIQTLRESLRLKDDRKVLVAIGRIAKEKNLDEIIENFSYIKDEKTILLIVGDGPYRKQLEEHVIGRNLSKRVIFTGMVSPDDVDKYYALGDIFVCASNSETQGLTYIESLACGLPVVCKEDECIKDVVNNDENGYIFNDRKSFLHAISAILDDKENHKRLSENARESSEKFSNSSFAKKIINVYEEALEEKMLKSMSYASIRFEEI